MLDAFVSQEQVVAIEGCKVMFNIPGLVDVEFDGKVHTAEDVAAGTWTVTFATSMIAEMCNLIFVGSARAQGSAQAQDKTA